MSAPLVDLISARAAVAGIPLSADESAALVAYCTLLERWNQKINLTALPLAAREPATIDRLIIEPLIASTVVEDAELMWCDFGSGGGSPAIPLKIVRRKAMLTMVEAKERKGAFLREAVSTLGLAGALVVTGRIEDVGATAASGTTDLVTVRAVRMDPEVLGAAWKILKLHGRLLVFRGQDIADERLDGFETVSRTSLHPSTGILAAYRRVS